MGGKIYNLSVLLLTLILRSLVKRIRKLKDVYYVYDVFDL